MSIAIRQLGALIVVSAVWLATLAVNLWVVLEHYLSAQSALTLLGTEGWKLGSDSLLGHALAAFVPNGNLPQALALTLSAGLWLALLIVTFEVVGLTELLRHWAAARARTDEVEVQAAQWEIGKRLLFLAVLGTAMVEAIRWDLLLFEFRTLASLDPAQASAMVRLAGQDDGFLATYPAALAAVGARGYLGITLACAMGLEILSSRVGDKVELLGAALDRMWNPEDGVQVADEVGADGQQTNEAATDQQPDDGQEATLEAPAHATDTAVTRVRPVAPISPLVPPTGAPLFPPEIAARPVTGPPLAPAMQPVRTDMADMREVIGGLPGEVASLSDAQRQDDRYHVDLATQSVWPLELWESLHGPATSFEQEGRAA